MGYSLGFFLLRLFKRFLLRFLMIFWLLNLGELDLNFLVFIFYGIFDYIDRDD